MAVRNLAIISLLSLGVIECLGDRIVQTNVGSFRGFAASDGDYIEFLGIPYGQVNNANPFGVAAAYPAISGIYDANDDSTKCPQLLNGEIVGSLDCLRLNVFAPDYASAENQLPVMVFLHGGYFQKGHGNKDPFGPRFLMRHGVIIVSINYRSGPYGFMCLNRRAVPGNQGLKDQVLAFQWVRDNIAAFGGNPNQVTLFGISAGGHSIDLHLLSEQEHLFNKVIIQSGSSLATTLLYEPDRDAPIKLASYLNLEHNNASVALRSLSNAAPEDVVRAATQLNIQFKPCAETEFEGVDAFLTNYWINSVPRAQGLPIMIGFTEYENMMTHINEGNEHFQGLRNIFFNNLNQSFDFDNERVSRMEGYARRFYIGDEDIDQNVVWPIINFESDYWYAHPIQRSIKKFIDNGAANIFYYMFSYSGGRNEASINNINVSRASHADDIRYLFAIPRAPAQISAQDQLIIDRMTSMWTNFAKFSNPTPEVTSLLPVQWVSIESNADTGDIYNYLRIDTNLTIERRPFNRRLAFWDLFYKLNNEHQRSFEAAAAAEDDDDIDDGNNTTIMSASLINILLALLLVAGLRE